MLHRGRTGILPENTHYPDTGCPGGCDASLTCPLERCVYDLPGWYTRHVTTERNRKILRLWNIGWKTREIALEFGVSSRTVYRVLEEAVPS